jgi:Fungal N-terminal domain of STAND proteins
MEALGSVSSIIAVVQIAGSVAKLCGGYIADVKDARQDIERLQQKAATLQAVLQRMDEANDRRNPKPLNLSDNVLESVDRCLKDLWKLQGKLQPKTRHKTMSKFGMRALKWPLSKDAVNEEVRTIEGYLTVFNAALQLDHMYVSKHLSPHMAET